MRSAADPLMNAPSPPGRGHRGHRPALADEHPGGQGAGDTVQARFDGARLALARHGIGVTDADVGARVGEDLLLMAHPGWQIPADRPEAVDQVVQGRPGGYRVSWSRWRSSHGSRMPRLSRSTGSGPELLTFVNLAGGTDAHLQAGHRRASIGFSSMTATTEKTTDLLVAVLADLAPMVGDITGEQLHDPTPCTELDVGSSARTCWAG